VTARKIVIGVTGASGAPYARRLIALLRDRARESGDIELGCVLSPTARSVWKLECGGSPEDLGVRIFENDDYGAPFASGSAGWHAMAIVPCSMGTLGRIAHGMKERRTLVVVPRETPMSTIHLENLLALSRAGALVLPACPSFYGAPRTLEQALDTVVARALDHLGVEHALVKRWGSADPPKEAR